jgi:hypothetical protein
MIANDFHRHGAGFDDIYDDYGLRAAGPLATTLHTYGGVKQANNTLNAC